MTAGSQRTGQARWGANEIAKSPGAAFWRIWAILLAALLSFDLVAADGAAPGHELFSETAIRHFRIVLADSELEKLRRDHNTYVRSTVTVGDQEFRDAGVRLKGRGSFRPLEDKPSFALKFNEFTAGQRFCGLTKILLNNSSQDRSYLSEYLCTSLYRDAGVPAARVTFARVDLNGRELGIYVLIEAMNKVFLRQHFRNPNGPLYEAYAQDINSSRKLEQDSGPPSDQSDLRALVAAASAPVGERMAALRETLDVDRFASFLTVGMLIAQHDSYALNRNNYRLYREPDSSQFVMIAHGIDGSFTQNIMPIVPPPKYLLAKALLEIPEGQQLYRERMANLFTNVFKLEVMTNRLRFASERLYTAAENDEERANITRRTTNFIHRVVERYTNVVQQLNSIGVQ
ncbi:MAG: CotH kinase family protein [Verrucomicrobia subdivision 3 bacterium]|nr:CotH kinase family protein [Limisphaerales bacterium]